MPDDLLSSHKKNKLVNHSLRVQAWKLLKVLESSEYRSQYPHYRAADSRGFESIISKCYGCSRQAGLEGGCIA